MVWRGGARALELQAAFLRSRRGERLQTTGASPTTPPKRSREVSRARSVEVPEARQTSCPPMMVRVAAYPPFA